MTNPEMKQASPEHLAQVAALGDPIVDHIQSYPPGIAMEVLIYVIVRCFLDVGLKPGVTHTSAFDQYMAATRVTLIKNAEALGESHDH